MFDPGICIHLPPFQFIRRGECIYDRGICSGRQTKILGSGHMKIISPSEYENSIQSTGMNDVPKIHRG